MDVQQNILKNQFIKMPPLTNIFPIIFKNGCQLDNIASTCESCGYPFHDINFRGSINFKQVNQVNIHSIALCRCGIYEEFILRFQEDCDQVYAVERLPTGQWQRKNALLNKNLSTVHGLITYCISFYYDMNRWILRILKQHHHLK